MQTNRANLEAALVISGDRLLGQDLAPRQLLKFLQTLALLFEQTLLAVAYQITLARQRHLGEYRSGKKYASQHGEQLSHRNHPWPQERLVMMGKMPSPSNQEAEAM